MNTSKIGKQIMTLRKEQGYTQENLAELLSVSPQAVSKWENGRALPDTSLLDAGEYLEVTKARHFWTGEMRMKQSFSAS